LAVRELLLEEGSVEVLKGVFYLAFENHPHACAESGDLYLPNQHSDHKLNIPGYQLIPNLSNPQSDYIHKGK
jgi:hypothetical protein